MTGLALSQWQLRQDQNPFADSPVSMRSETMRPCSELRP
jgi:hypothetical protein